MFPQDGRTASTSPSRFQACSRLFFFGVLSWHFCSHFYYCIFSSFHYSICDFYLFLGKSFRRIQSIVLIPPLPPTHTQSRDFVLFFDSSKLRVYCLVLSWNHALVWDSFFTLKPLSLYIPFREMAQTFTFSAKLLLFLFLKFSFIHSSLSLSLSPLSLSTLFLSHKHQPTPKLMWTRYDNSSKVSTVIKTEYVEMTTGDISAR